MTLWAIVPVQRFANGKSRLAPVLPDNARVLLAMSMFEHVFAVLQRSPEVTQILIVTDCPDIEIGAGKLGARTLRDPGHARQPLGILLDRALAHAASHGATDALIVMADLPHLQLADIGKMTQALKNYAVALGPDRELEGTNVMALRLPATGPTCFGRIGSFLLHVEQARAHNADLAVIMSPSVAFDVDRPEDYAELNQP